MTGINKPFAALFVLFLAAVVAVPAQASSVVKKPVVPKPKCIIGPIVYNDQTALVAVKSGRCFVPAYKGHKLQNLRIVKWTYSWIGYDQDNVVVGPSSKGTGKGKSFVLNPARFDHVKVTFTITSPKTKKRPKASASTWKVIQTGGNGTSSGKLGDGPGNTPPAIVNGVNPLCPFTDPYVESKLMGAQCGTYVQGSGAFVTSATKDADGTIHAGKWLTPVGQCAAPPNTAKGPYLWFGYNVFLVTGYMCGDGSLFSQIGVTTITLVNPDGSSCTLHPDGFEVATFRLRPEWGGIAKVTFVGTTINTQNGNSWPPEYETTQLKLGGTQNGCASSDWKIESVQ